MIAGVAISGVSISFLLLAPRTVPLPIQLAALSAPAGLWWMLRRRESRSQSIRIGGIIVVSAVLLALAVVVPPRDSRDVWSYQMYGRIITQHHSSPYTHVPNDFPSDPFLTQVAKGWRNTPSVYGPAFSVVTAAGALMAGNSMTAARMFHQMLAALAIIGALILVWRRTRSPAALAFLGLNPLVMVVVVNSGHNDALVGLALLAGALVAERRAYRFAGLLIAVAALIKITALLALPALLVWIARRAGLRAGFGCAGVALGTLAVGFLSAGPSAFNALRSNARFVSRASIWQMPRRVIADLDARTFRPSTVTLLALAAVVVLALVAAMLPSRRTSPAAAMALCLGAYFAAGAYVLPWYALWFLPLVAIQDDDRLHRFAVACCLALPAAYLAKWNAPHGVASGWIVVDSIVIPLALLGFFCAALLQGRTRLQDVRPWTDRSSARGFLDCAAYEPAAREST